MLAGEDHIVAVMLLTSGGQHPSELSTQKVSDEVRDLL